MMRPDIVRFFSLYLACGYLTVAFTVGRPSSHRPFQACQDAVSFESLRPSRTRLLSTASASSEMKYAPAVPSDVTTDSLRDELMDLLSLLSPSNATQVQRVESLINELEDRYQNPLTVDFFRLTAMLPSWQLILSTSQLASKQRTAVRQFRLRGIVQNGASKDSFVTTAHWEYSETDDGAFGCSGVFQIQSSYDMPAHSTRLQQFECPEQPVLKLSKGSDLPLDVPTIIKRLHQSIPAELFDSTMHDAIDTTYVDAKLKIIRYAGKMEGTRNVFIRQQSE